MTTPHYAGGDLVAVAPSNDCGCDHHRPAGQPTSRVLIQPDARPLREVSWDGRHQHDWRGHEAGLLGVAEAASLFDQLYRQLEQAESATPVTVPAA